VSCRRGNSFWPQNPYSVFIWPFRLNTEPVVYAALRGDSSFGLASLYVFHDPLSPPPRVDHSPARQQVKSGWRVARRNETGWVLTIPPSVSLR
jgi:hypothetical protein